MTAKVNCIAKGYHSVTPYLVIKNASAAIEFYKSAFGAVATWLSGPHKTRSIGAIYSGESGAQYMFDMNATASSDAILFVEKTTAARKNP
jgi:hypothetical protein